MAGKSRTATVIELQQEGILLVEDGNHGEYRPRPDEFVDHGVAFIRATDMDAGRVLFESASKINELARQRITKGIGAPGDVLLSHKGTVGKVALVPNDAPPFVCSPQTTFWRTLDPQRLDRRFLYTFLRSPGFHAQLATRAGETDMAPYVSLTSQRGLSVTLPSIEIQRALAHILGTLDDKIELNRRMNETLEAMARTLFQSWFVDFDPVLPKPLADLFQDAFEDSELGEIPKGWRSGCLNEVTGFLGGYAFKSKDWVEQGVPVVKIGSVKPGIVDLSATSFVCKQVADEVPRYRLSAGDLLIGMTGYVGEVGLVPPTDNPPLLNQRVGKFVLEKPGTSALAFLYCLTRQPEFKAQVETKSHGTAQANVSAEGILSIQIVVPPITLRDKFNRICQPVINRILASHAESVTLTALRDTLLPRLLSGEISPGK
jgi:type I restriction enzyme, S subunit